MVPTHYEHQKHSGELPIVGVNTFLNPEEKEQDQIQRLRDFQKRHSVSPRPASRGEGGREAPGEGPSDAALAHLKQTAINNGNIFGALMDAVRVCSLGQITHALFEVGGQYRRSM